MQQSGYLVNCGQRFCIETAVYVTVIDLKQIQIYLMRAQHVLRILNKGIDAVIKSSLDIRGSQFQGSLF